MSVIAPFRNAVAVLLMSAATAAVADEPTAEAPAVAEAAPETAAPPAPAAKSPWLGDIAIGVVNTSGNTSTRSVNARGAIEYRRTRWGNRFSALAFSGTRDGLTTDERAKLKRLQREVVELKRANEILKKASAYFAQAELDRRGK